MHLAAPVYEAERSVSVSAARPVWAELHPCDLCAWNDILLKSAASLYQYPLWNEPYRRLGVTPRYLVFGSTVHPLAFAALLTVGLGPARIGLIFRGPTSLVPDQPSPQEMYTQLLDWARAHRFMFLRITHSDPQVLSEIAASGRALDVDAFPYMLDYPILSEDYIVEQYETDDETLASFDREARRKIRHANAAGYEFHSDDSPEALAQIWKLYQECSQRKAFRIERPLSFYMDLMRGARPRNRARLYTVRLNGEVVGSMLVFRDRTTAHCQLAAFQAAHRSTAAFLHWHSMRDMYRMGVRRYNLGPGPGSLARFKSQFCRFPAHYPGPLTMVLKENWFWMWQRAFIPVAKQLQPLLRAIAFRRAASSS